jgi:hypothetical protein
MGEQADRTERYLRFEFNQNHKVPPAYSDAEEECACSLTAVGMTFKGTGLKLHGTISLCSPMPKGMGL